jgi:hypothetical protein
LRKFPDDATPTTETAVPPVVIAWMFPNPTIDPVAPTSV